MFDEVSTHYRISLARADAVRLDRERRVESLRRMLYNLCDAKDDGDRLYRQAWNDAINLAMLDIRNAQ